MAPSSSCAGKAVGTRSADGNGASPADDAAPPSAPGDAAASGAIPAVPASEASAAAAAGEAGSTSWRTGHFISAAGLGFGPHACPGGARAQGGHFRRVLLFNHSLYTDSACCTLAAGLVFAPTPVKEFRGHKADVLDVCWSRTHFLLSASMDKTVRLWHPTVVDCLRVFK